MGFSKLKLMNFGSKWDLFSSGNKLEMRVRPPQFLFDSYLVIFLYTDTKKVSLDG
jgi:hypothetical protein